MPFAILDRVRSKYTSNPTMPRNFSRSNVPVPDIKDTDFGVVKGIDSGGIYQVELDRFPGSIVEFSEAWLDPAPQYNFAPSSGFVIPKPVEVKFEAVPNEKLTKLCDCTVNQLFFGGCKCGGK